MTIKKTLYPYPVVLTLRLHDSLEKAKKHMDLSDFGVTTLKDDGEIIVDLCLASIPKAVILNIIIHESVHVCQFL